MEWSTWRNAVQPETSKQAHRSGKCMQRIKDWKCACEKFDTEKFWSSARYCNGLLDLEKNCLPLSRWRDNFVGIWYDKVIKWILRKQSLSSWNGYTCFCIVSSEDFSESGNQLPGCLKDPALLVRLNDWLQKEILRSWFSWLNTCKIK
jgi:hypothetical protein